MRTTRILLVAFALALLAGCVNPKVEKQEEQIKQAARYNVQMGVNYMRNNELQLANTKLQKALEQNPDLPDAHNAYAVLQERLGQFDEAEKHYRKAIDLAPDDSEARNNYAAFLCRLDRYDEADKEFNLALKNPLYQRPEIALTNAGLCALRVPNQDKAEQYFRRALADNGEFIPALYQMALLSFDNKNYLQTRAYIQRYEAAMEKLAAAAQMSSKDDPQAVSPKVSPQILWICVRAEAELGNVAASSGCSKRLKEQFPDSRETAELLEYERRARIQR